MEKMIVQKRKTSQVIADFLHAEAEKRNSTLGTLGDCRVIADAKTGQFQLVRFGWSGDRFYFTVLLHFEEKADGKIWIWQNNTESPVGQLLAEKGISSDQIVLGFKPEFLRPYTGFAAN